jgi:hypothetical protein
MLASNGEQPWIDDLHTRAICEEIGERLREMLRHSASDGLPPRLHDLMQELARAELEAAPPLVPSIEDMTAQNEADRLPA